MLIRLLTAAVCTALAVLSFGSAGAAALALHKQHATATWPTTWGLVIQSEIGQEPGPVGVPVDRHKLAYEYSVGGRPYASARWTSYIAPVDTTRDNPDARADATPLLDEIKVHYNPLNPELAVVSPGVRSREWLVGGGLVGVLTLLGIRLSRDVFRTARELMGLESARVVAAEQNERRQQIIPSAGPTNTDSDASDAPTRSFNFNLDVPDEPAPSTAPTRSPRAIAEHILGALADVKPTADDAPKRRSKPTPGGTQHDARFSIRTSGRARRRAA